MGCFPLGNKVEQIKMSVIDKYRKSGCFIFGFGVTGKAVAKFLTAHDINFTIIDDLPSSELSEMERNAIDLSKHPVAIISPGWKKDHSLVKLARAEKIEIISEVDFAWEIKCELFPDQIWLGVTGTNGKTTTVQMLESILQAGGKRAVAAGNVGKTILETMLEPDSYEVLAIEISSFQLDWSELPKFHAGAILNIAPDHIDWHGNFENYRKAKIKLLEKSEYKIINLDDEEVAELRNDCEIGFTLNTPKPGEIGLVEEFLIDRAFVPDPSMAMECATLADISPLAPHNVSNALAAIALARSVSLNAPEISAGLKAFQIDHHRLERVGEFAGMTWIDDSKATNPHAAIASLKSFTDVIWIVGGLIKGADLQPVMEIANERAKIALVIGKEQSEVITALSSFAPKVKVVALPNSIVGRELMNQVVECALENQFESGVVLLAPAAASMDQFASYKDRGECFAQAVRDIAGES
jgi:UDP-N-acetylmuramoylalanine--D-glutamate ligase